MRNNAAGMRRDEVVDPSPPHARAPGARHSAGPARLAQSLRPSASSRNAEGTIHASREGIGRVSNPATFLLGRLFDSTACPTPPHDHTSVVRLHGAPADVSRVTMKA